MTEYDSKKLALYGIETKIKNKCLITVCKGVDLKAIADLRSLCIQYEELSHACDEIAKDVLQETGRAISEKS